MSGPEQLAEGKRGGRPSKKALIIIAGALLALVLLCALGVRRLRFEMPGSTAVSRYALAGLTVKTPVPPEYEGYVFLGWQSEDGEIHSGGTLRAYAGGSYSPVYTVALTREHVQYLFPDEYGFFHPYDNMTRGEAAEMLYALLAAEVDSAGNYADVDGGAPWAKATAALYHLQVTDGVCFYPEEELRLGELLSMLARFYPAGDKSFDIADVSPQSSAYGAYCLALEKGWVQLDEQGRLLPGATVTRLEVCRLMDRVLDRPGSADAETLKGLIPDMEPEAEGFAQVAEAAMTHRYSLEDGLETYEDYAPITRLEEGFRQVGASLYYVEKDGTVLTDGYRDSLYFGEDGRYTSGDGKLDSLIDGVLERTLDGSMDAMERLRAVYDYTVRNFEYRRGNALRRGATGWEAKEAYDMLSAGKGNCYSYAAVFCMLARAVGFDAQARAGTVDFIDSAHGWVEIEIDGYNYLFDPELEMTCLFNNGTKLDRFMFTWDQANGWTYDSSEK